MAQQKRFIPVKEFAKTHPWPSENALRHLIFNSNDNGFDQVVKRVGRRVLIDEDAFYEWIEKQNDNSDTDR